MDVSVLNIYKIVWVKLSCLEILLLTFSFRMGLWDSNLSQLRGSLLSKHIYVLYIYMFVHTNMGLFTCLYRRISLQNQYYKLCLCMKIRKREIMWSKKQYEWTGTTTNININESHKNYLDVKFNHQNYLLSPIHKLLFSVAGNWTFHLNL